jgi:hypothetical protein
VHSLGGTIRTEEGIDRLGFLVVDHS